MRPFLIGVVLIGIVVALLFLRNPTLPISPEPKPSPTPIVSLTPSPPALSVDIDEHGRTYRIAWLPVRDPSAIILIPNFTNKRTARSLIDSKECIEVVNGGFYTKDNQPTGLFIAEGKTVRGSIPNTLFNGYIVVNQDNNALVLSTPPEGFVRIGLQTGPILVREGNAMKLAIRDDEFARRVVSGVTQEGALVFLVLYNPENPYEGPKLADLPNILSKVTSRLEITDAVNLDGGSASVFIRGDLALEELTPVGSFFCIQE